MSKFDVFSNKFAEDIFKQKYSMNQQETWQDTCKRVVEAVCGQYLDNETKEKIFNLMLERKFIPAGRYLYASGRSYHQINNCLALRAEDSREGWSELMSKVTAALMSGAGLGVDYSKIRPEGTFISRTGGTCSGPLSLMHMVNETGRFIMQGGQRRSAIFAGLNWKHEDIYKFLSAKDWSEKMRQLKKEDFNFPLPLEGTNISVTYDTEFFVAIDKKEHPFHKHAKAIWRQNCLQAFSTAEPGFSFNFLKDNESLRNAPISANTKVLTRNGYIKVADIIEKEIVIWTGKQWAKTTFKKTKENSSLVKVILSNGRSIICDPEHPFIAKDFLRIGRTKKIISKRVEARKLNKKQKIFNDLPLDTCFDDNIISNTHQYGLGFVFGDGSIKNKRGEISYHIKDKEQCFLTSIEGLNAHTVSDHNRAYFKCDIDSKEELLCNNTLSIEFIAGWFDADGCYTRNLLRISNSNKSNLIKLQESLDFYGIKSNVREDGTSSYKPKNKMYTLAILSDSLLLFKSRIPTIRIKVDLEKTYKPFRSSETRVVDVINLDYTEDVYCCDVGVDEHSFLAEGVIISNCCEFTSEDDSDKCNLGTVWINRFSEKAEFAEAVELATKFLMCGGIYSDVPYEKVREIGDKNNKIGLGIGGFYEWLIDRGYEYEVTPELHKWLHAYKDESDSSAYITAKELDVAIPKSKRAIAPNGTIGILAESTTGIEPLFCKAYKRRYLKDNKTVYQYVVDGTTKRLLDKGVALDRIFDSYDLDFRSRVKFQADVQEYVDMAISSTCNLPMWGTEKNNEETVKDYSKILLKYAKKLRGFTCYPDGCRDGQPLTPVDLKEALESEGQIFEETIRECTNGVCGL